MQLHTYLVYYLKYKDIICIQGNTYYTDVLFLTEFPENYSDHNNANHPQNTFWKIQNWHNLFTGINP